MSNIVSIRTPLIGKQTQIICVNVIATYQDLPQEIFDCVVQVAPINTTISNQLSVEMSVLSQVVSELSGNKDYLQKISLCYELPEFETYDEIVENGFGFIFRTNSKYWFCSEETDFFEQEVIQKLNISRQVRQLVAQSN